MIIEEMVKLIDSPSFTKYVEENYDQFKQLEEFQKYLEMLENFITPSDELIKVEIYNTDGTGPYSIERAHKTGEHIIKNGKIIS